MDDSTQILRWDRGVLRREVAFGGKKTTLPEQTQCKSALKALHKSRLTTA